MYQFLNELQALIFKQVPFENIVNLYQSICKNDNLWRIMTMQRFGEVTKLSDRTWYQTYFQLYRQNQLGLLRQIIELVDNCFNYSIVIGRLH